LAGKVTKERAIPFPITGRLEIGGVGEKMNSPAASLQLKLKNDGMFPRGGTAEDVQPVEAVRMLPKAGLAGRSADQRTRIIFPR
jgi:hypothetical protein